jgi:hypothetical protein
MQDYMVFHRQLIFGQPIKLPSSVRQSFVIAKTKVVIGPPLPSLSYGFRDFGIYFLQANIHAD